MRPALPGREWVAKAIHGEGNVVFLGGPAGNPVSAHELAGVVEAFKKYPKITLLTGDKDWPVTNWDSALIQQNMTALLNKYPKIDAVINDSDGFASLGVVRAYQSANKPLVPLASLEANGLACEYEKQKASNPISRSARSQAATGSAAWRRARRSRLREGLKNDEPTRFRARDLRRFARRPRAGLRPVAGAGHFHFLAADRRRTRQIRQGRLSETR